MRSFDFKSHRKNSKNNLREAYIEIKPIQLTTLTSPQGTKLIPQRIHEKMRFRLLYPGIQLAEVLIMSDNPLDH